MAEIRVSRAGCEDQIIISHLHISKVYFPGRNIDRLYLRENDLDISAFAQYSAHGRRDVGRRQRGRRHLVEQRLEKMIIGAVDYRDVHIFARQFLCRFESAESCANDHNLRSLQ